MSSSDDLSLPQSAVLLKSTESAACHGTIVAGYDFDKYGVDYERLLDSYMTTGYQATNLGIAFEIVNRMIADRQRQPIIVDGISTTFDYPVGRAKTGCTIFLGYTSNLVSCGLREIICYLAKHDMIDCLVTSAGGIEEDLIKCLAPTYLGGFSMSDAQLRSDGINRIGNLLVPNDNYCRFEDWLMPILDQCLDEQQKTNFNWTPSKLIRRLGQTIDNESSIYYWAYRNNIPVYCPALTDGSLGDMLYFHSYKNPGLRLDIIEDVRNINNMAVKSTKSGAIILGGGLVKHHINNANLMRNGSDYVVYVNTGQEFDGSDSGARPEEAVSWGKIKSTAEHVKVHADATLVFPLIVAKTFAKQQQRNL